MEMLNSNQALMETNLQGAVAVAIVTAAKLETQTRRLLDSFGAPASRWCQGWGSRWAGVHPWPQGVGEDPALLQVLPDFVPSPTQDGKTRFELVSSEGQTQHGGPGAVGQVWGLARAEQSLARYKGQNAQAMSQELSPWCQTREVAWGWGAVGMLWWDAG